MKTVFQQSNLTLSAIILTAGKSQRFGQPKAFLPFSEQESFIQHLLSVYSSVALSKIVIVCNKDLEEKIKNHSKSFNRNASITIVVNEHPETGRFGSIKKGIAAISNASASFIQNIDNPFVCADLIESMKAKLKSATFIAPVCNGIKGHPILLSSEILNHIRNIKSDDYNLRELLTEYSCIELKTQEEGIHANINTLDLYQKYFVQESIY